MSALLETRGDRAPQQHSSRAGGGRGRGRIGGGKPHQRGQEDRRLAAAKEGRRRDTAVMGVPRSAAGGRLRARPAAGAAWEGGGGAIHSPKQRGRGGDTEHATRGMEEIVGKSSANTRPGRSSVFSFTVLCCLQSAGMSRLECRCAARTRFSCRAAHADRRLATRETTAF